MTQTVQFFTIAAWPHGLVAECADNWFFVSHQGAIKALPQRPPQLLDTDTVSRTFMDYGGVGAKIAAMVAAPVMPPAEFIQARQSLGLNQRQMAAMLGLGSATRVSEIENGKPTSQSVIRLMRAYVAGYRPDDWPI